MKVAITGGAGFIGSHLLQSLYHKSTHIVVIDNLSNSKLPDFFLKHGHFVEDQFKSSRLCFHKVDIRDKFSLESIFAKNNKIDICIHLAAQISVTDSIKDPKKTVDININGTKNILDMCIKSGINNFVFASSAAVYGNPTRLPLSENEAVHPISPYGESKLKAEQLVSSYSKEIQNAKSLRFFNIYGDGQTPEYAGVITKFAGRLNNGLSPIIYGSGCQTRDFISVHDVTKAIILASRIDKHDRNDSRNGFVSNSDMNTFNIGTGVPSRILDVANMMIDLFQSKKQSISFSKTIKPIHAPSVEGDIIESYADITKAKQSLGFRYYYDINAGLKELYA
ncbi:MAG: GDP-mannose 4,6-dehydratase [Nitrososphaeraceae archaeon]